MDACNADKIDVIKEYDRQLQEPDVYKKLSFEEMENLIKEIQAKLRGIVERHKYKGSITQTEKEFLLSKEQVFKIPYFYIVWKILKNPPIGRPIVAGYDWILTPASIYIGMFLRKFYSKFQIILTDSLELIRFIVKNTFHMDGMLFTIFFKSLCTNIPVQDAI